jgi:hypothetical protein
MSRGGGGWTLFQEWFKYNLLPQLSTFVDRVFKSLFIEIDIPNQSKIIIGSVYRPGNHPSLPHTEQFQQLSELLTNLCCEELSDINYQSYICGDINLDVL